MVLRGAWTPNLLQHPPPLKHAMQLKPWSLLCKLGLKTHPGSSLLTSSFPMGGWCLLALQKQQWAHALYSLPSAHSLRGTSVFIS